MYTDREKMLATMVMQKWLKMYITRKRYQQRIKIVEKQWSLSINYEITPGKYYRLHVIVKKYQNPTVYKYIIANQENRYKRDDMLTI